MRDVFYKVGGRDNAACFNLDGFENQRGNFLARETVPQQVFGEVIAALEVAL
jgi:hypothetical protein